jgi:hypothetical protein
MNSTISKQALDLIQDAKAMQKALANQYLKVKITMYIPTQSYQMRELSEEAANRKLINEQSKNKLNISVKLIPNENYNALITKMRHCYQQVVEISLPDPENISRGIQVQFTRLIPKNAVNEILEKLSKIREDFIEFFQKEITANKETFKNIVKQMFTVENIDTDSEQLRQFIIDKCIQKIENFSSKSEEVFEFSLKPIKIYDEIESTIESLDGQEQLVVQLISALFDTENNVISMLTNTLSNLEQLIKRQLREETVKNKLTHVEQLNELINAMKSNIPTESPIQERLSKVYTIIQKIATNLKNIKVRKADGDEIDKLLIYIEQKQLKQNIKAALDVIKEEYGLQTEDDDEALEDTLDNSEIPSAQQMCLAVLQEFQNWLNAQRVRPERGIKLDRIVKGLREFLEDPELIEKLDMTVLSHEQYIQKKQAKAGELTKKRQEAIQKIEKMKQSIMGIESRDETSDNSQEEQTNDDIMQRMNDYLGESSTMG